VLGVYDLNFVGNIGIGYYGEILREVHQRALEDRGLPLGGLPEEREIATISECFDADLEIRDIDPPFLQMVYFGAELDEKQELNIRANEKIRVNLGIGAEDDICGVSSILYVWGNESAPLATPVANGCYYSGAFGAPNSGQVDISKDMVSIAEIGPLGINSGSWYTLWESPYIDSDSFDGSSCILALDFVEVCDPYNCATWARQPMYDQYKDSWDNGKIFPFPESIEEHLPYIRVNLIE
jgi:hypothetical protein